VAAGSAQTTYDAVGRATGLNSWDPVNYVWNPVTSGATYNAAGQITGWQEGAVALTRGYDAARGWMTTLTASAGYPYNQTYLNMQYGYNADGQATSVTDSVNSGQAVTSYTYDNLNRLASATTPNWSMSWTYDEFGNRTSETGTGTAASLTSSLSYDQSTNRITTSGYGYDSNGNLTASPGKTYAYDAFDHLVSGSYGAGNSYDAFGRRIAHTLSDGSTQFYFYDTGGKLIQEYHFDPNVQCSVYGNLVPCPTLDGTPPIYTYFAGQRVGQWTDRTGSKRRDASSTSHYYPYGEEITSTNNDTYKFAQLYRDSDSGLDYAKNRYYVSNIGRFLTPDRLHISPTPAAPQSWSRYSYGNSDPVNWIDPGGKWGCSLALDDPCDGPCDPSEEYCPDPPPGPGRPTTDAPECFIQVEYRPIDSPVAAAQDATHTYLFVQDRNGNDYVLEGEPQHSYNPLKQGYGLLRSVRTPGPKGDPNNPGDNAWSDKKFGSVYSSANDTFVCDMVDYVIGLAKSFNATHPNSYYHLEGPNSASYTYYFVTLLTQMYWSHYFGPPTPLFPEPPGLVLDGWGIMP
jgi:RHS repeat-associated protein